MSSPEKKFFAKAKNIAKRFEADEVTTTNRLVEFANSITPDMPKAEVKQAVRDVITEQKWDERTPNKTAKENRSFAKKKLMQIANLRQPATEETDEPRTDDAATTVIEAMKVLAGSQN